MELKKDIQNIYIGIYDDNKIGFFKRLKWVTNDNKSAGEVYVGTPFAGLDNKMVSKRTFKPANNFHWDLPGTFIIIYDRLYVVNCHMKECISFDEMRKILFENNKIPFYELGKASLEEIIEVMNLAFDGFTLMEENSIVRKREK